MKRIVGLILVFAMVFSLCSCNGKGDSADVSSASGEVSDVSESVAGVVDNESQTSSEEEPIVVTDKSLYIPHSLTVSYYDAENNVYGFTWNTDSKPYNPVLQVCEGTVFDESKATNYKAELETMSKANVCKARVTLEAGKTYSYRAYDTRTLIGGDSFTIKARNTSSGSFTFAHFSDSQVSDDTTKAGELFGSILSFLDSRYSNLGFVLHTGDVVQNGGKESDWRNMLEPSVEYLSALPFMAISGNHCSTYGGKDYNTYKHFDVKKPSQNLKAGYYYSFEYSNVKFVMIDTNSVTDQNKLSDEQYYWLEAELENNDKQWLIVAMHNPMYSVGKYGADPEKNAIALALREQLGDLFAKHGVDLVLQGHDHVYSYTYPIAEGNTPIKDTEIRDNCYVNPEGVVYAMHGPAGNQDRAPYKIDSNIYKYTAIGSKGSWAEITINGNQLTVNVIRYNSGSPEIAFSYGIIKE